MASDDLRLFFDREYFLGTDVGPVPFHEISFYRFDAVRYLSCLLSNSVSYQHSQTHTVLLSHICPSSSCDNTPHTPAKGTHVRKHPSSTPPTNPTMVREVDLRSTSAFSQDLPSGLAPSPPQAPVIVEQPRVELSDINPRTGIPQKVTPVGATHNRISLAMEYVQSIAPAIGFLPDAPPSFIPDPNVQTNKSGAAVVHLHQYFHGVPVFQTVRAVRFRPDRTIRDVVGDSAVIPSDFSVIPSLSIVDAFKKVMEFINEPDNSSPDTDPFGQTIPPADMSKYTSYLPKITAAFPVPAKRTVLEKGPFDHAPCGSLVIFNQYPQLLLAWEFAVSLTDNTGDFTILVAAGPENPGEILYSLDMTTRMVARGNVYTINGANPRKMVDFPPKLSDYPIMPKLGEPIPDFPRQWVASDMTVGNSTQAVLGNTTTTLKAVVNGDVLTFDPADANGDDQKLLNIFYYCCYMHDFFFLLGFDEPAGNFQEINFTQLASGSDSVVARAHPAAVFGTANMRTPPDGMNPEMNMGLVVQTDRHTAFSADVVFHEFVHGVTNRCVGGRLNSQALVAPQSRGMGEGWSDFFSLTVQNFYRDVEETVVGAWIVANTGGIRGFPYDDQFPDSFGNLGTGRYAGRAPHPIGEIWCACLMSLNRRLVEALGKEKGYNVTWRVVFDGLQTTMANPSFLDARNEIFNALDDLNANRELVLVDYETAREAMRSTFAKYGMGPRATSNGASLFGVVADFQP